MSITNPFHLDGAAEAHPALAPGRAVRETQAAVHAALDALADSIQDLGSQTADAAHDGLSAGMHAVRSTSHALMDRARAGQHQAQRTIRDDPMKSVLIAAASGAALAALVALAIRPRKAG